MKYLQENKDITKLSNFRTPARARYFFELVWRDDIEKLYEIIQWSKTQELSVLFISSGTNMLFAFEEYNGIVIKNSLLWWTYDHHSQILETLSAESIWEIAETLETDYGQDLWHRFIGLPGSIAGAIYGNAGCFGLETENNFLDCEVLDLNTWKTSVFEKKEMDFSYRNSKLKQEKKYFIISARFDLSEKIEKYHSDVDNIDFRENKQPKGMCCGSFFKNPSRDYSAWRLIEEVWLKGYKIGGAYFSEKHANFLMHDGQGSFQDMWDLIELAQKKVKKQFDIQLENEVQIIRNIKKECLK